MEQVVTSPSVIRMDDIIAMTAKLARLLAKEVQYLKERRFNDVEALQDEKIKATEALEGVKKELQLNPEIKEQFTGEEREDFKSVFGIFEQIMVENHERLWVTREVNTMLVEAIREAAEEQIGGMSYDEHGADERSTVLPSLKLNEVI